MSPRGFGQKSVKTSPPPVAVIRVGYKRTPLRRPAGMNRAMKINLAAAAVFIVGGVGMMVVIARHDRGTLILNEYCAADALKCFAFTASLSCGGATRTAEIEADSLAAARAALASRAGACQAGEVRCTSGLARENRATAAPAWTVDNSLSCEGSDA